MYDDNNAGTPDVPVDASFGADTEAGKTLDEFLAQLLSGAQARSPQISDALHDRYENLVDNVNEAIAKVESEDVQDYHLHVNSRELGLVLNAIGWFFCEVAASDQDTASTLLDVAERGAHLTHNHQVVV